MSERLRTFLAIYTAMIGICLTLSAMGVFVYGGLKQEAALKVMTLELKGQSRTIIRMGQLRNEFDRKADAFLYATVLLAIAGFMVSPAPVSSRVGAWFLVAVSVIAFGSAGWFVGTAILFH